MVKFKCPNCKKIIIVAIGAIFITCELCGHHYEIRIDPHIHQDDFTQRYNMAYDSMFTSVSSGISYLPNHRNVNYY